VRTRQANQVVLQADNVSFLTVAFCVVVTLLACFAPAADAHAQEGDARQRQAAAEAYDQGTAAYVARDYQKAAQWFETANRLSPAAPALIQGTRSHYKAGNLARAATLALQLTVAYSSEPSAVEVGENMLSEAAPQLLRVDVECEGCSLDIDGTLQEFKSFYLAPDVAHTVTASFETGERSTEVSGAAGEAKSLSFEAPPPTVVPAKKRLPDEVDPDEGFEMSADGRPRDAAKKPLPPLVTFIGAGVTGALLIGSIISTVDVYARADDYEAAADKANAACQANPGSSDCTTQYNKANQLLDDGEPTEMRTTILWVATGVVGAATAIIALTLTDWSSGDDDASAGAAHTLHLQPLIDPVQGSAGLRLGAQF
jgi:tetratricopeptide (TPR) repeat protein